MRHYQCPIMLARRACYEQSKKTEVASCLKLKVQENNADSLDCWRNNGERMPLIKQLGLKYLCIPAMLAPFSFLMAMGGRPKPELCFLSGWLR